MKNTVIQNLLKNMAICLATGGMLAACGGGDSQGPTASDTKLMADGEPCNAAWVSTTAYGGGGKVSRSGRNYTANWWTQGNDPVTSSGPAGSGQPWLPGYLCGGTTTTTKASTTTTKASTTTTKASTTTTKASTTTTKASTTTTGVGTTTTTKATTTTTGVSSCPAYVAGTAYAAGKTVTNAGGYYTCTVAGWCSSGASAYEPGVGWAWSSAWSAASASVCGGTTTTTNATTTTTGTGTTTTTKTTTTTTGVVTPGLPKHALVGYWHNFTNPAGPTYRIRDVTNEWDVIMISFGEDGGNGAVTFTLDPNAGTEAQFIADIAAKRAAGKKVVLSLGGQEGRMTLSTAENVTNFVNSLHALIVKYGFDGIDLDLESGAGVTLGSPIINNLITAVKQLKAKVGPSFYLSMAPEHPYVQGGYVAFSGIWGAYLPIIDGLRNELNVIHVQYYNNGGLYTPYSAGALNEGTVDALVGGSKMLIEGFKTVGGTGWEFKGLRPDQVAFGVPSGPRSANQGFVTAATVKNTLTCMAQLVGCGAIKPLVAYPTYRGVMTWSINWDKFDGFNFSIPAEAALNALP